MKKLVAKYTINGKITLLTGLHIGGSKSDYEIGGVDNLVIKTKNKMPYIPGSSLKGKLRSLLAKKRGWLTIEEEEEPLTEIFGHSGSNNKKGEVAQLLVRDCFLENKDETDNEKFLEEKTENSVDRKTGTASNPRDTERVVAGTGFKLDMIYDEYEEDGKLKTNEHFKELKQGFLLLMDDYIGGSGSRGYGKIKIEGVKIKKKNIINSSYENDKEFIIEDLLSHKFD